MPRKLIDLTGRRFGSWTVLGRVDGNYVHDFGSHSIPRWLCRCDCGTEAVVLGNNLKSGASTGCQRCRVDKMHGGLREYRRANRGIRGSYGY